MVKETHYYDLLEVEVTATEVELKKAYRKQAIRHHPDKNGNSAEAAAKFQEIVEAYEVLLDSQRRALYDEFGAEGLTSEMQAAPEFVWADFITSIYGGEGFAPWIGQLSSLSDMLLAPEDMLTEEMQMITHGDKQQRREHAQAMREHYRTVHQEAKIKREARVAELAKELVDKITKYRSSDNSAFVAELHREFEELKLELFGLQLLHLIGKAYVDRATAAILKSKTFGVSKVFTGAKNTGSRIKSGVLIITSLLDAKAVAEKMAELPEGVELTEEEQYMRLEQERLATGKFLAAGWASNKHEVVGIINSVTDTVLNDKSIDKKERAARAAAIKWLGKEMLAVKRSPEEEEEARIFEEMMFGAGNKKKSKVNTEWKEKFAEQMNAAFKDVEED